MKGINLDFIFSRDIPHQLFTDKKRLIQILINLISNGIKYTHSGSVTVRARVGYPKMQNFKFNREYPEERQMLLHFSVIDTGVGIATSQIPKLFQLFHSVKTKNSVNRNGIGLGLTISKKLVEQLGGEISVQSQEGSGTCFNFSVLAVPRNLLRRGEPGF